MGRKEREGSAAVSQKDGEISALPSGLCLALGNGSPPPNLLLPRGEMDAVKWPTPESNRGLGAVGGGGGRQPSLRALWGTAVW